MFPQRLGSSMYRKNTFCRGLDCLMTRFLASSPVAQHLHLNLGRTHQVSIKVGMAKSIKNVFLATALPLGFGYGRIQVYSRCAFVLIPNCVPSIHPFCPAETTASLLPTR